MLSFRALFERLLLPWYRLDDERERDLRTERIARHSELARQRAERVIAEYRTAEVKADAAAERVIDHARRE